MVITALPGHHPRELADPTWMVTWLARYDPTTETIPQWNAPIDVGFGEFPPWPAATMSEQATTIG
jgi:hypothetical protein